MAATTNVVDYSNVKTYLTIFMDQSRNTNYVHQSLVSFYEQCNDMLIAHPFLKDEIELPSEDDNFLLDSQIPMPADCLLFLDNIIKKYIDIDLEFGIESQSRARVQGELSDHLLNGTPVENTDKLYEFANAVNQGRHSRFYCQVHFNSLAFKRIYQICVILQTEALMTQILKDSITNEEYDMFQLLLTKLNHFATTQKQKIGQEIDFNGYIQFDGDINLLMELILVSQLTNRLSPLYDSIYEAITNYRTEQLAQTNVTITGAIEHFKEFLDQNVISVDQEGLTPEQVRFMQERNLTKIFAWPDLEKEKLQFNLYSSDISLDDWIFLPPLPVDNEVGHYQYEKTLHLKGRWNGEFGEMYAHEFDNGYIATIDFDLFESALSSHYGVDFENMSRWLLSEEYKTLFAVSAMSVQPDSTQENPGLFEGIIFETEEDGQIAFNFSDESETEPVEEAVASA